MEHFLSFLLALTISVLASGRIWIAAFRTFRGSDEKSGLQKLFGENH